MSLKAVEEDGMPFVGQEADHRTWPDHGTGADRGPEDDRGREADRGPVA
jgi:hypothetical protein